MNDDIETETKEDQVIPRIKRGRLFGRMALHDIFRIGMFAMMLYAVIALRKPCATGAENFLRSFDEPAAAQPDIEYRQLTPEEIKERFPSAVETQ